MYVPGTEPLGPLRKQQVLLTPEPSFQPCSQYDNVCARRKLRGCDTMSCATLPVSLCSVRELHTRLLLAYSWLCPSVSLSPINATASAPISVQFLCLIILFSLRFVYMILFRSCLIFFSVLFLCLVLVFSSSSFCPSPVSSAFCCSGSVPCPLHYISVQW